MWTCEHCGARLEIAKLGRMKYLRKAGMVILECNKCGFEFMIAAGKQEEVTKSVGKQEEVTKSLKAFDLEALRNKVTNFQLK